MIVTVFECHRYNKCMLFCAFILLNFLW